MSRIRGSLHVAPALALVIVFFTSATPSRAWSKFVHELICEMALEQLSSEHRGEVFMLSSGQNAVASFSTFASACEWADDVRRTTHRETREYHFINVPREAGNLDFARDCSAHDCVSQAVVRYAVYVASKDLDEDDRAEALRFLGHYIPDLHQPLHVGYAEDLGGNILFVALAQGQRSDRKLHAIWDGTIPQRLGLRAFGQGNARVRKMRDIAKRLVSEIPDNKKAEWRTPSVKAWARESYVHARDCAYQISCDPAAAPLGNGSFLSDTYWERAEGIVEERIKMASVRLAFILERALSDELDPASMEAD